MKKLKCQKGQGSLMLILMIAGAIGVIASSLMLNMMNLQRASISLRIRSVAIRAVEEIAQEVKQAYDLHDQTNTDCTDFSAALVHVPAVSPRFCFRNDTNAVYYYNRFTLRRGGGSFIPQYTAVKNEYHPEEIGFSKMFASSLPFLKKAFGFTNAAYPYLPPTGNGPLLNVTMNSNACTAITEPCIVCGTNADCYQFDVCMNSSFTCAAPMMIRPIFAFMR